MMGYLIILIAAVFCGVAVIQGDMPLHVGASIFSGVLLIFGAVLAGAYVADYRERSRINRDAFVREVIAAHQRRREAREACERA